MNKELLFSVTKKDFKVEQIRSSKSGGQRRDKVATACRITHLASGAVALCQDQRNYDQNKRTAFRRLLETDKWKTWHRIEVAKHCGMLEDIEKAVELQMRPNNLKIEYINA